MAIPIGTILRCSVEGDWNNVSEIVNVYHIIKAAGSTDEADVLDDIIEILEALYVILGSALSTLYTINQVRVTRPLESLDVGTAFFVDDTPGTNGSETLPLQTALGATFFTQDLGVRGRKFWGPISEPVTGGGGQLTGTFPTVLADAIAFTIQHHSVTNGEYGIGVVRSADNAFLDFTSGVGSPTAVTQRRRRIGVGS